MVLASVEGLHFEVWLIQQITNVCVTGVTSYDLYSNDTANY